VPSEVAQIADTVPNSQIYLDEAATGAALRQHAGTGDVLHLATHGLFRRDNPTFSAVKLHDGWLTAQEIAQLPSVAAHVTLSACESGRADATGCEGLGLARAFLGAGAASLLLTQWLVLDEVAALLMPHWYAAVGRAVAPAAALQAAQQAVRERYPHPYYWAPFVLVGRR